MKQTTSGLLRHGHYLRPRTRFSSFFLPVGVGSIPSHLIFYAMPHAVLGYLFANSAALISPPAPPRARQHHTHCARFVLLHM